MPQASPAPASAPFAIAAAVGALPPGEGSTRLPLAPGAGGPPPSLVKWGPVLETPLPPSRGGGAPRAGREKEEPTTLLDRLLPPRRWTVAVAASASASSTAARPAQQQQQLVAREQRVSAEPATRADAVALARALEERLLAEGARPRGLCPRRSALHAQALDELARQSATACAERGALLLRVRDEHRETVRSLERVRAAAARCAVRAAVGGEHRAAELEARAATAEARAAAAERERDAWAARCAEAVREGEERLARLEAERRAEVGFLGLRCEVLERAAVATDADGVGIGVDVGVTFVD